MIFVKLMQKNLIKNATMMAAMCLVSRNSSNVLKRVNTIHPYIMSNYSSLSAVVPGSHATIAREIFQQCCRAIEENLTMFIYKLPRTLTDTQLDHIFASIPAGPLYHVSYSPLSGEAAIIVQINNV